MYERREHAFRQIKKAKIRLNKDNRRFLACDDLAEGVWNSPMALTGQCSLNMS
jgi:hypothetical protein